MGDIQQPTAADYAMSEAVDVKRASEALEKRVSELELFVDFIVSLWQFERNVSREELEQDFADYRQQKRELEQKELLSKSPQRNRYASNVTVEEQVSKSDSGAFAINLSEVEG